MNMVADRGDHLVKTKPRCVSLGCRIRFVQHSRRSVQQFRRHILLSVIDPGEYSPVLGGNAALVRPRLLLYIAA
jgi:hypothetical protein